jgi:hypothetical protein
MSKLVKLSVASTLSTSNPSSPNSDVNLGWALVRTNPKSKFTALKLPIAIGSTVDSDIIINAPTLRPVSKIVASQNGILVMTDVQTLAVDETWDLDLFGVEIHGPFAGNPLLMPGHKRHLEWMLATERKAFKIKYPSFFQKYLPKNQLRRLALIGGSAFFALGALAFSPETVQEIPDLSKASIAVKSGNVTDLSIKTPAGLSAYASGVTLSLDPTAHAKEDHYVLSLAMSGLDIEKEFSIYFNSKLIGTTHAHLKCIDSICNFDYPVAGDLLDSAGDTVTLTHASPGSSYVLKSVFFRNMVPANSEEIEIVTQLLAASARFFEDKELLIQNIRLAKEALAEAEGILTTRTGLADLEAKFVIAKRQVTDQFNSKAKDLQTRCEMDMQLGRNKEALLLINDLLKLYPNQTTHQYNTLVKMRKSLQEKLK